MPAMRSDKQLPGSAVGEAVSSVSLNGRPPRCSNRRVLLVYQQHKEAQSESHSRPRRPHLVHWRAPPSAGGLRENKHATQTRLHADVLIMYPVPLMKRSVSGGQPLDSVAAPPLP